MADHFLAHLTVDLPEFDITEAGLTGDVYHERLAAASQHGWLVKAPLAYIVANSHYNLFVTCVR